MGDINSTIHKMPVEPATLASAVFSGLTALIKISQQTAQFVKIPDEIVQVLKNVEVADDSILTARRLQRDNPLQVLGEKLMEDVDRSVEHAESVLLKLRSTIEDCRVDLIDKKTVGVKSRTKWMLWKEREFSSSLATLTIALGTLDRNIVRMEIAARDSKPALPNYDQAVHEGASAFPRAPSMRKRMSRRRLFDDSNDGWKLDSNAGEWDLMSDETETGEQEASRPRLVHIRSAPEEIPQRQPGSWTSEQCEDHGDDDDVLSELQSWGRNNRYLSPTAGPPRRRSNYI